jgi:hypothetical protein
MIGVTPNKEGYPAHKEPDLRREVFVVDFGSNHKD